MLNLSALRVIDGPNYHAVPPLLTAWNLKRELQRGKTTYSDRKPTASEGGKRKRVTQEVSKD